MKRVVAVLLAVAVFLTLGGCFVKPTQYETEEGQFANSASTGVWISYMEIRKMLTSENGFKAEVSKLVENCLALKIENVYVHVRSHCDSLYPSEYFPLVESAKGIGFDTFGYIADELHKNSINVHAWINPYRVSSSTDINALPQDSIARQWLFDDDTENDKNIAFHNGIYLNPAEEDVRRLILNGIREIMDNYQVESIHFDDYFYPTGNTEFDNKSYEEYKNTTKKPLPLDDWRRANVSTLISSCYALVKYKDSDTLFGVSPSASIEKNKNEIYADVGKWIEDGILDYVVPQLYFGFEYPMEEYRFENLLSEWKSLASKNENVKLIIGLPTYKIGSVLEPDKAEWQTKTDIIAKQAELCFKDSAVSGYVFFSYSSLFSQEDLNTKQRNAYLEYMKNK
ncbi:MAG: hypothetical protein E7560_01880 [Ruminococcaceae bacterium]|nr:hypothetical protein [Oscillospiraceae bacterium]